MIYTSLRGYLVLKSGLYKQAIQHFTDNAALRPDIWVCGAHHGSSGTQELSEGTEKAGFQTALNTLVYKNGVYARLPRTALTFRTTQVTNSDQPPKGTCLYLQKR